jgi:hypothetical protein
MIWFLRLLFAVVIASMIAVTGWAGGQCGLFAIPPAVLHHPWFIATLFDAYWGFITFYVWVAWKERGTAARLLWFAAIILLGNLAMASYMMGELVAVDAGASGGLDRVFLKQNPGRLALPGALAAAGVAIYLGAWLS